MDTHTFPEGVKVQHFCLTLVGEGRLWYESLRPINVDWIMLFNILLLINQYSSSITINVIAKTMNNIGISHGYFIRSLGLCISP